MNYSSSDRLFVYRNSVFDDAIEQGFGVDGLGQLDSQEISLYYDHIDRLNRNQVLSVNEEYEFIFFIQKQIEHICYIRWRLMTNNTIWHSSILKE